MSGTAVQIFRVLYILICPEKNQKPLWRGGDEEGCAQTRVHMEMLVEVDKKWCVMGKEDWRRGGNGWGGKMGRVGG